MKTKTSKPTQYELLLDLKWIADGARTAAQIAEILEGWAERLRRIDQLGIRPESPVRGGQTLFETSLLVAKKLGFDQRLEEQLRELEAAHRGGWRGRRSG